MSATPMRNDAMVLVLLATWNGALYLGEQLDSIARQSYPNWQIVIADDGSTDATMSIVKQFEKENPGKVMILSETPVGSAKGNFFRLLREAPSADYYALCDQDDVWRVDKLDKLVGVCAQMESRHGPDTPALVYSDLAVVDSALAVLAPSFMNEIETVPARVTFGSILVENSLPGCSMLINASMLRAFRAYRGPLDEAIMHDWWIALLGHGAGTVSYVPEPLVLYRQHAANAAGSVRRRGLRFVLGKLAASRSEAATAALRQASLFHRAYADQLPGTCNETLAAYAEFSERGKIWRIRNCLTHGILKQTFSRRIYQLIKI